MNYIFDLYGTLIDLRTDEHTPKTWKKWLSWLDECGIKHPPYYVFREDFFSRDKRDRALALRTGKYEVPEIDVIPIYRELFELYGNGILSDEMLNKASYAFREASRFYIRLFPAVKEYLSQIRDNGDKAYILSNAQRSYTMPEIEMFGLDELVEDILISSDYGCMKPDKGFYNAIITKHNMDKSQTIMHGDSYENDYQGAIDAGIKAVHLAGDNSPKYYYLNQISGSKNGAIRISS